MSPKIITTEQFQKYLQTCEGHDRVLQKVKIVSVENGNCVAELKVEEEHVNSLKGLHGSLSAALVDVLTSFGLLTYEQCPGVPSVSVDLHISYVKGAVVGDEIVVNARTLRAGKTLAYLECEITNKLTGELLVKGTQTKYLMHPKEPNNS